MASPISADVWTVTAFTVACGLAATVVALPLGIALAWLLARGRMPARALLETLVTLPLVLPPVATGLILLELVGPRGPVGRLLRAAGIELVYTWRAVVLAMAVMGLPLLVRTARAGFEHVDRRFEDIALTLGATPLRAFFTVTLPLARRSLVAGAVLAFARALGEFGATVMIAGSIPGSTRTLSTSIYAYAESGMDEQALVLVVVSALLSFGSVLYANRLTAGWDAGR